VTPDVDMPAGNALLRIFWPSDAPRHSRPGVLVGWRNSEYDVMVISILHEVEVCQTFND
jgi:phosphatidylinositol N-acetylglucosaminyltransferase subunit Q